MELLLAVGVFALAIALLSLGTVAFRRPIKGSCGGLASAMGKDGDGTCQVCGRSVDDCPEKEPRPSRVLARDEKSRTR